MALKQRKQNVMSATEFSKIDVKAGALTYNQQWNRCTIPLLNKSFVQLQGMAEPIRSFDADGAKSSHCVSFLEQTSGDFKIFGAAMKNLGMESVRRHEDNIVRVLAGAGAHAKHIEHKDLVKEKDGVSKINFYVHPKFTKYFTYDRDLKIKSVVDFETMRLQPMGFYSIIVKVAHVAISLEKPLGKLVCGPVAYVDSLCYILPRESEKKGIKYAEETVMEERPEFDVAGFDSLRGIGAVHGGYAISDSSSSSQEKRKRKKVE